MNWELASAWMALVLAAGAGCVALLARKDSKTSAEASVRSAVAAEASLALQRAEAEERRVASLPRPDFAVEQLGHNAYALRNVGTAAASGVRILPLDLPEMVQSLPDGEELAPGAGHRFVMAGSNRRGVPTHVTVTWDGAAAPMVVPLPRA